VVIDLDKKTYLIDHEQLVDKILFNTIDFSHPLLVQPILTSNDNDYEYHYSNLDGLINCAPSIYATLLAADNPNDCQFTIKPHASFLETYATNAIFLSLHAQRKATKKITLSQLNHIISDYSGFFFHYQDQLVLNTHLSFNDLPTFVDGDKLFYVDTEIKRIMTEKTNHQRYELRYINQTIGFGVYTKVFIREGEIVCGYYGIKELLSRGDKRYFFNTQKDSLNLGINSRQFGNIARFINHAPMTLTKKSSKYCFLTANLIAKSHWLNGLEVIFFHAKRPIAVGEQLLIDYGEAFFTQKACISFTTSNHFIDINDKKLSQSTTEKRVMLWIMAQHGVIEAWWLVLKRPFIITIIVFLFCHIW
jgi:hypothetical protein